MRTTLLMLSAVVAAGALLPLAFSPFNWYWVPIPALSLLFWSWQRSSPALSLLLGWGFGVGMFGTGVTWVYVSIHDMGQLAVWLSVVITALLVAVLALYPALLGWITVKWFPAAPSLRLLLVFPAGWVLFEWLRGVLFTGFAWLWLGHAQVDGPLIELLPVIGSLGASWVIAVTAGAVAYAVVADGPSRWVPPVVASLAWLALVLAPAQSWTTPLAKPVSYSLVQGGRPQELRWQPEQRAEIVREYLDLTATEWGRDLIVWPENAVPIFFHRVPSLLDALNRGARDSGSVLLAGIPFMDLASREYFNSVAAFPESVGRYDKRHLVPFTEFLPLKRWLQGLLDFFQVPMSDFSGGPAGQPPMWVGDVSVGVSICYEAAFAWDALASLPRAQLLVNVSNDGWFGDSLGPHQHLQIARVRALEGGRSMLRATNNGITAQIDHRGRVVARADRFEPAVLRGEVLPMSGSTPYVRWGDWPVLGLMSVLLGLSLLARIFHQAGRRLTFFL